MNINILDSLDFDLEKMNLEKTNDLKKNKLEKVDDIDDYENQDYKLKESNLATFTFK